MRRVAAARQFIDRNPITLVIGILGGAAAAKSSHGLWALGSMVSISTVGFLLGQNVAALLFRIRDYFDA